MKLVYHGVSDAIEIDLPGGGLLIAKNGEPFEVTAEMGASLLEQDTYSEAVDPKEAEKAAKAAAKEAAAVAKAEKDAAEATEAAAAEAAKAENANQTDGDAAEKE